MDQSGLGSRAIIGKFYEILELGQQASWPFQIGMEIPSDQESETYKWLGASPAMREWVGGRQAKGLKENGITITNKKFEATLEIDVDDHRRDKTKQIDIRIAEMADQVNGHWADLLTTLLLANGNCYDGKAFFATNHSEGASGTQVNALTKSHVTALTVASTTAVTPAEMAKAILGVIGYMLSIKNDQGKAMNRNAKSFQIQVPIALWAASVQAVTMNNLAISGGGNQDNPLLKFGLQLDVVPNADLDSTSTVVFYVYRRDGRAKPFILQSEEDVSISAIAEGSEEEFKNNRHLYGVKALRNVGFGYWQQAAKATLST